MSTATTTNPATVAVLQPCKSCQFWRPGMSGFSCRCTESKFYALRTLANFSCTEGVKKP